MAQQGDAAAFELIYRLHSRRVYALCLRIVKNASEADDLTQEAFLQVLRKIHTFRGESAFSSWLYRLTANLVLMRFRKKKLMSTSLDEITTGDDENNGPGIQFGEPDLQLTGLFDRVNLQTGIDGLPEGCRETFILHDVQGYEHTEIAQILGCSVGNSKSQLHRARSRLRRILQSLDSYGVQQNREAAGLAFGGSL